MCGASMAWAGPDPPRVMVLSEVWFMRRCGFWANGRSLVAVLMVCLALPASGGDWPQILGPNRNGRAEGETVAAAWPAEGPPCRWRYPLGSGYAGAAVVGHRVVVFHRVKDQERLECLDADTGRSLWQANFPATYRGGVDPDTGPRCVPLVVQDTVYAFGAAGDLYAVDLASGHPRWQRSLYADYQADEGYFGAGSTPLYLAHRLLINVGGKGAGLVALDPTSGQTLWKTTDEAASYAAPTLFSSPVGPAALFVTRLNCLWVEPDRGRVHPLFPFGQRGPTVNAAMPLVVEGRLFVTASYGIGAVCARLEHGQANVEWKSDQVLSSQYATPVAHEGLLFGIHGREDVGVAELRCVEVATGRLRWRVPGYGVAHLILAGNRLVIQKVDGWLALAEASGTAYRELAKAQIAHVPTRALPALAGGRLYVRTGSGGGELLCLDLSAGQP